MKIDVDAAARLRAIVKQEGTQRAAALKLGISQGQLFDLLKGNRGFSDQMLAKLGLRRTVVAVEK